MPNISHRLFFILTTGLSNGILNWLFMKLYLLFSYFQPGWIVQLVRFQLGWFFCSRWNQLSWKLSNEILVLFHCFTKSFVIGYHFLTKPITTLTWSQQPIRMIQLGWKPFRWKKSARLTWQIVQKNIICLDPLGWFYNY